MFDEKLANEITKPSKPQIEFAHDDFLRLNVSWKADAAVSLIILKSGGWSGTIRNENWNYQYSRS